ncbi:MAG: Fur family transcriptional regulator [Enterococcus italicus]|uniref:Fur family transcriptional regulator n=1 Tax=Enterococcus italicus TaxID=246144 RepID=UPI003994B76B
MTATLNLIIDSLKQKNIRITPQRIAILEVLIQSKNHPTAEEVYKQIEVDFPGMSVATVYNNLRLFTDLGFVTEMSYGDSASRFDFTTELHYHAICSKCGKITDFHYPNLDDIEIAASRLTGYKIDSHRLEVYGLCPACQKEVVE